MNFVTTEFVVFFALTASIYYFILRGLKRWDLAKPFLLIASLFCYSFWYYPYLAILLLVIGIDYFAGQAIYRSPDQRTRKAFLIVSLCLNLGILGFFKYTNFFLDSIISLGTSLGFRLDPRHLNILLPIGISFHTFQSMSYTIDIYRREGKPAENFWAFALFVAFFPQLVAGPIVRAVEFLPQLESPKRFHWKVFYWGCFLIILGVFKKVVIADNVAPYVDYFFQLPDHRDFHSLTCWFYLIAYSVQIYADFSGYSDIAIGLAHLLGFRFPPNFYYPYIALGFGDFWRRWHISLSKWIRDYLYFSLGGGRRGGWFTLRNLIITMFLAGLWHGANWTFVAWGLLHGCYLVLDHLALRPLRSRLPSVLIRGATFAGVVYAWVFFRSQDIAQALEISRAMFTQFSGPAIRHELNLVTGQYWGIIMVMHLVVLLKFRDTLHKRFRTPLYFVCSLAMILAILFNRKVGGNAFIYFQF